MARNLSVQKHFERQAQTFRPEFRFRGQSEGDWRRWRESLLPKVSATLGALPARVPLNSEVLAEWTQDGLRKQKVVFDVEDGLSATAYVFRPQAFNKPGPAIFCCHGHGQFGKEPVMGVRSSRDIVANIERANYDYGLAMARAGFVTMSIDWRGFGERDDRKAPHYIASDDTRDLCNVNYLRAGMLGQSMLGLNLHDAARALDYLTEQPFVDPDRIGVMGISLGGTMATWIALTDDRVRAADVVCYSDRFADFAITRRNMCGSQITNGLYTLCDVPDLQGLIAPRPLLVEIGVGDRCFFVESALSCFREVQTIYDAAGAGEHLWLDVFEGGHVWGGNRSADFFRRYL